MTIGSINLHVAQTTPRDSILKPIPRTTSSKDSKDRSSTFSLSLLSSFAFYCCGQEEKQIKKLRARCVAHKRLSIKLKEMLVAGLIQNVHSSSVFRHKNDNAVTVPEAAPPLVPRQKHQCIETFC